MKKIAVHLARDLRKRMTDPENQFWELVRNKRFLGLKFLRQHPIYYELDNRHRFFIADFYCREKHLVIEIDGGIHEQQKEYDTVREEIFKALGLKTIRFTNSEIQADNNKILLKLKKQIDML